MIRGKISINELLGRIWDLFILNLLFVLCAIPIITIGASLTAMHRVLLQMVRDEDLHIAQRFFQTFLREFKQSTLLWLPMLVIAAVLFADQTMILPGLDGAPRTLLFFASVFFEAFWILLMIYLWPLQARYANPLRQTVKNALLIGVWKFAQTLLCALIYLALPLAYMLFASAQPVVMILYLICGFSVPGLLADMILHRVFLEVIPDEQEDQDP